uniref:RNA-directed DNA polymerase, eukaryota, nucleotide-binding alpha-beta plait domain protein n=1 Tax=Tanacetum cinerariifolium TaxID=118510 RepID=A0A699HHK6_TANCI|nr:RNA-directed DNA polymerase, eukaryota, nucleotide-binding alpha-beta plait domain protein [Tanacetum cinerariifolium]
MKECSSIPPHISSKPALVLDDLYLLERDFSKDLMRKVKDVTTIPNLPFILSKVGFPNVKITYLGGLWALFHLDSLELKDKINRVVDSSACKRICFRTKVDNTINERVKIIIRGKVHWIRAKELDTWEPDFDKENADSSSEDEFAAE